MLYNRKIVLKLWFLVSKMIFHKISLIGKLEIYWWERHIYVTSKSNVIAKFLFAYDFVLDYMITEFYNKSVHVWVE